MSIRSILREAIESDRSLDLGELLDKNGFSDVAVEGAGEALLHYADMAPLAQAEALSPVVAAYHRQVHDLGETGEGFEISLDLPTVKVEFFEEIDDDHHLDDDLDIDNKTQNLDDDSTASTSVDSLDSEEITLANRFDKANERGDEENSDRFGEGSMEHTDFAILSDLDVADVAPIVDEPQWSSVVKIEDASDADLDQAGSSLGTEFEEVAIDAANDFDIDFE